MRPLVVVTLLDGRHLPIETLGALPSLGHRIHRAEIPPLRLLQQNVVQRGAGQIDRHFQVFGEPAVPGDQPPVAIEDAETLSHVFERALQQRALFGELLLARAQFVYRSPLAVQRAEHEPPQAA